MDTFINMVGRTLSQCIHVSNHLTVHFKYLNNFVNYTSKKLGGKNPLSPRVMGNGD